MEGNIRKDSADVKKKEKKKDRKDGRKEIDKRMHSRALLIVWWFHEWLSANEGPQIRNSKVWRGCQEEWRTPVYGVASRSLWRMKGRR